MFFEKVRKWNGLLIEADPSNYGVLKTKNRKAFSVNACLSPRSTPAKVSIGSDKNLCTANIFATYMVVKIGQWFLNKTGFNIVCCLTSSEQ